MGTKLFVGNLDFSLGDTDLRSAFAEYGEIVSATVILDRMTGQSRGFGFVEFENADSAQKAIDGLHGATLGGRAINVNIARERESRGGGGGGGYGGGGGGGGRGGYGGGGGGGGRGGYGGGGGGGGRGDRGGRGGRGGDRGGDRW